MTLIHRAPMVEPQPSRRAFYEDCPSPTCTSAYGADGTPDPDLLRTWRLAHAKHWEEMDDA